MLEVYLRMLEEEIITLDDVYPSYRDIVEEAWNARKN